MPAWLAPLAISVGSSLIGRALNGGNNKERRPAPAPRDPRLQAFEAAATRTGERGEQAEQQYLNRLQTFDPMATATAANNAQYTMVMPQIKRAIGDLRGQQVAQGRLNTGYGMNDQDQLLTDNLNHLNQSMIARSMDATQMSMANNAQLGAYATNARNTFMDASLGRYQTEEDQRRADEASKRSMWGQLGGATIGALGNYAGRRWGGS